jgi:fructose-1,6-bisphosphatase/inositol monophosphatase family enzyme
VSDLEKELIDLGNSLREVVSTRPDSKSKFLVVGMGADGTATHQLDKICDEHILNFIRERDLPLNLISEESGFTDFGYEESLMVDPLDGTYNAEHGIPFYSFSGAVVRKDLSSARIAIVSDLAREVNYHAVKGKGAFANGKPIHVSKEPVGCALGGLGRAGHDHVSPILRGGWRIRSLGCASMELCLVAAGSADIMAYVGDFNSLRNIDVAGGVLILREAGGVVLDGEFLDFNMGLDVRERKSVIGASTREVAEALR